MCLCDKQIVTYFPARCHAQALIFKMSDRCCKQKRGRKSKQAAYWKSLTSLRKNAAVGNCGFIITCRPEDNLIHTARDTCALLQETVERLSKKRSPVIGETPNGLDNELELLRHSHFKVCFKSQASKQSAFICFDKFNLLMDLADFLYENMHNFRIRSSPVRLIPVLWTCRGLAATLEDTVKTKLIPYMAAKCPYPKTYSIQSKVSRNTDLSKDVVFDIICQELRANDYTRLPGSNDDCPVVYCHVQNKRCCLTVLQKFSKRCNYNWKAFVETPTDTNLENKLNI